MNKQLFKDGFVWGFIIWLIGYILGIVFFMFVPLEMIGWYIMPIGILFALWVLIKKVRGETLQYFLKVAIIWTSVAVVFDYLFLVKLLQPAGGYYKIDVYIYYIFTFVLPLIVGWRKLSNKQ